MTKAWVMIAWLISFIRKLRWALPLIAVMLTVIIIRSSPSPKENEPLADDKMCLQDGGLDLDEELDEASLRCRGNAREMPVLYAHYLLPSSLEEICTDDLLEESHGALHCAPGPRLLFHGNVDAHENTWILNSLPDYFAWHLDDKSGVDEMIYIANANGFPIKSQSIKLENDMSSTMVLFPKTTLAPGVKYYLYLSRTTATGKERWIQRIMMSAANE